MQVVKFYRGEQGNHNGHMLNDIMSWKDGALEMDHDWVQWTFPSNEPSGMNINAPIFTLEESKIFEEDKELQDKVKQSLVRFLEFLQFFLMESDEHIVIQPLVDKPRWLNSFNHTMLRITRLLKSLRLTGLTKYAIALYNTLKLYKNEVSSNTWNHWHNAVFDPLW